MEIKVGDYVRTKDGLIGKLEQINKEPTDENVTYIITDTFIGMLEEILKHSPNIIDLIEAGDIIEYKSYSFDDILKEEVWKTKGNNIVYTIDGTEVNINSIKSIVTKEMFSNVEYRVENN